MGDANEVPLPIVPLPPPFHRETMLLAGAKTSTLSLYWEPLLEEVVHFSSFSSDPPTEITLV